MEKISQQDGLTVALAIRKYAKKYNIKPPGVVGTRELFEIVADHITQGRQEAVDRGEDLL